MFGCGVTALQNMVSSSNIRGFMSLDPRSTNRHTIAMAGKANCNKKVKNISLSLMIMIIMVVNLKLRVSTEKSNFLR